MMSEKRRGEHSSRVKRAIESYDPEEQENLYETCEPQKKNFVLDLWDKLGKTGQVLTLVAGILTALTTIKPYALDVYNFSVKFVHSIENTDVNTENIKKLKKYNEVLTSILKMELYEYWYTNPDGKKVKLFKTREVHGKHMTYFFDNDDFPWVVNLNVESGHWYYIDGEGVYHEIV
jgi:hypothetical protein